MKAGFLFAAILITTSTLPAGAGERLTLQVSPAVAFAPANLVVRARVVADAANRAIAIVAESGEFYRSSEIQLDGENAPRTNTFEFRSLPPGTYEVKATVLDSRGKSLASASQRINVMTSGADPGRR